jgi:predicted glycosyl hydrolase (DUF1957 family)
MEYRHYIKVKLGLDWQEEREEIKASPQVFVVVECYDEDRGIWWEAGLRWMEYQFTIEEAEAARQKIIESIENRKEEANQIIKKPSDPDYDPDFDSVF